METQTVKNQASEIISATLASKATKKPVVKSTAKLAVKTAPKAASKIVTKVAGIATQKKTVVNPTVKEEPKKVNVVVAKTSTSPKASAQKIANKIKTTDTSTVTKVIETGKITSKILSIAGGKLLNNSIKSTKAIAGIYSKVGKKALSLGKELMNETSKVMADNRKVMKDTSMKAFKETVETIQESHLIAFPFKNK